MPYKQKTSRIKVRGEAKWTDELPVIAVGTANSKVDFNIKPGHIVELDEVSSVIGVKRNAVANSKGYGIAVENINYDSNAEDQLDQDYVAADSTSASDFGKTAVFVEPLQSGDVVFVRCGTANAVTPGTLLTTASGGTAGESVNGCVTDTTTGQNAIFQAMESIDQTNAYDQNLVKVKVL